MGDGQLLDYCVACHRNVRESWGREKDFWYLARDDVVQEVKARGLEETARDLIREDKAQPFTPPRKS